MTTDRSRRGDSPQAEDGGLEEKIQAYHRQGGPPAATGPVKDLEGDIGATAMRRNDGLKKARPKFSQASKR
jgi:hypothetical protein